MELWALFLPTVVGFVIWLAGMKLGLQSLMPKVGIVILAAWGLVLLIGAFAADDLLSPGGFPLLVLGVPALVNLFAAALAVMSLKNALKHHRVLGSKEN